jgi:hypothetical protein
MSAVQVDAIIVKLRTFVAAGPHRGILVEAVKKVPRGTDLTGVERPGAWLAKARRPKADAWLPADYRHFLATWGSLTWLAPEGDVPDRYWFYLGNVGAKALIDLNERFDLLDAAEAAGLEDAAGLDRIHVFHDGYNAGFAFDARVTNRAGEALVVPFVEDTIHAFLGKKRPKPVGTFVEWLDARVTGCIAALERNAAPSPARVSTQVPASIKVPANRGIDLKDRVDVDAGWPLLQKRQFAKVATLARAALNRDPVFLYAHAQLLDALGGLVATAKDANALRRERYTVAWTLLALARRGVEDIHADYHKMFRQKALTVLAELSLEAPELVSIAQGKKLIAEAAGMRVDPDPGNAGIWDTPGVKRRLDKTR